MAKKKRSSRDMSANGFQSAYRSPFRSNFYDGGKKTLANRDFYNAINDFEATATPDRDTLRARARWIHENNPIIANIDRTISANVVGGGIKFQFKMGGERADDGAKALNDEIETAWEFAKESLDITGRDHFDEMCKIALKGRFMDGENLFYLPYVKDGSQVNLKIQALEVDRFALGSFNTENGLFYDGVETDKYGKVVAYHLQNNLFRNASIKGQKIESDVRLDAKDVLYFYKRDNRPTQYRGISEYKQVITDLKNFAAQMRATIEAARSRANIAYAMVTNNTPQMSAFAKDGREPIEEINGIFVRYLNQGEKLEVLDPKIADDNFDAFVRTVVRLIATGRSVSYELAFRDYAQVNYSSGRMSWLQDYKLFDEEFLHFTRNFYKPIFMRWLEFEALKGSFKYLTYEKFKQLKPLIATKAIKLYPPKREWVDPLKESKSVATELEYNTTTLEAVYAKRGLDWQEEILQISEEKKYLESLGLTRFNNAKLIVDTREENDE